MEIYDVVKKLLGKVKPVAETNTDGARFENLKATTELVGKLLANISNVAYSYKNRQEYSVKRAASFASAFLDELGIAE